MSYIEGYVDYTGRVRGYGVCNLDDALPTYDWRLSTKNVWKVENLLIDWPHRKIKTSDTRFRALLKYYKAFRKQYGKKPWRHLRGRERWSELPNDPNFEP